MGGVVGAIACIAAVLGGLTGSGVFGTNAAHPAKVRTAPALHHVLGESYRICKDRPYLKSPWTYHALKRGSRRYTVAQYERMRAHGASLPPLPSYIAREPKKATAAVIYAPGAASSSPAYKFPLSPVLQFFEGGPYGSISLSSTSGDVFVGGSAPGYPQPEFTGGGIGAQNDSYDFSGGGSTLVVSEPAGSRSITTRHALGGYATEIAFPDRRSYKMAGVSGTTITLSSPLKAPEAAGTTVWANRVSPLAKLSVRAAQGATTMQTRATRVPVLPWEHLDIGTADGAVETAQVSKARGSKASGYALTLDQPLSAAVPVGAPVYYAGPASDVTVEYLNIGSGGGNTTLDVTGASGWTIEHNDIHDNYAGGAAYQTTSSAGTAIIGADHSVIEYNCFQRLGEYALNGGGVGTKFDYNQVDETPYQPDLSGNGQSGCGKWWGSANNDVVGNAFTDERYSACIWFDNGNTGMLVQGNYFYDIAGTAVGNETGYNSEYIGNLFDDVSTGINLNDSGGWDIPGSRYNNEVVIQGNTFYNALEAINIWGASGRSCLNSGEAAANGESDPYCSGGFPQMPPTEQYFSHYQDSTVGGVATVADNETCSPSSPCSTVTLSAAPAVEDWVGFDGLAPDTCTSGGCGGYADDPVQTTTSDTTNVSTFTGSGTVDVASSAGFPSSGRVIADTSEGSYPLSSGAVLSYSGVTSTALTGVSLVAGGGALTSGGTVIAVQPYHVAAVSCPGSNCTDNAVVSVSPAITSDLVAGTEVYATGTCPYYVTAAATPSSPTAPNGMSYYDGCMWEDRNISVTANTFEVDPAQFSSMPLPEGESGTWSCTTGPTGNCAQDIMGYQYPGSDAAPYSTPALANAMMSGSSLPAPYNNLNASGSPLAAGTNGDVGPNGATPYNNLWSGNTYVGDWTFQAYTQAAGCPLNWTGSALRWVNSGGNACSGLSLSEWQSIWHQD